MLDIGVLPGFEAHLRKHYNLSLEDYHALRAQQGYACAICLRTEAQLGRRLFVDHNHATGEVRGLLCASCNTYLHRVDADPTILERLAKYTQGRTFTPKPPKEQKLGQSTDDKQMLLSIAANQSGYFTSWQARSAGYTYPKQTYHVRVGNWERVGPGIFRLVGYPEVERPDLVLVSMLSLTHEAEPAAVFSHDTALALLDISDANPACLHVTVPPGFRRHLLPSVIRHSAVLQPSDWEEREGYRVTTLLRTLRDIAESATSWPYLEQALKDAHARGVTLAQVLAACKDSETAYRRAMTLT